MKRFNPEKELNKIKKENKNKIILFVISLLVVGVIGYSFALYQVRYSKRIIYTKVSPFSDNKDIILTVLVDGKKQEDFPNKEDGYYFDGLDCETEGVTTATWNYNLWALNLTSTKPNKCDVLFNKEPSILAERIRFLNEHKEENIASLADDDPSNNIRYIGKDPNNYIWFNCNSYDNLTQETAEQQCEKWRIIGLFKGIEKASGEIEDFVKIIRDEPLPNYYVWDNKSSGIGSSTSNDGSNDWNDSRLMMLLNPNYENSKLNASGVTGSLYWNSQKGKCLGAMSETNESRGTTIDCDFSTTGLKNEPTKNMIESVKWKLGGWNTSSIKTSDFYTYERGTKVYSGHQTEWAGYIGLMYPSDYGYATSGGGEHDRSACLAHVLYNWSDSGYQEDCAENDWLLDSINRQYTLMPLSSSAASVFRTYPNGSINAFEANYAWKVRPSLYLKSGVKVMSGDGSSEIPYILSII